MTPIDYVALVSAIAQGVPAVVRLLQQAGCLISDCPAEPADRAPLPDLASRYRDAADEIDLAAAGISRR